MATLRFGDQGLSIYQFNVSNLWSGTITRRDSSRIQVQDTDETVDFSGSFTYPSTAGVSGTLTSITEKMQSSGATVATLTGLNFSASTFYNLAVTGDNESARAQLLSGNDIIYGGSGNDVIYGYAGRDVLDAGGGNDTIYLGDVDAATGGAGIDTAYLVETARVLASDMEYTVGSSGDDWIAIGRGGSKVWGGKGADTILVATTDGYAGADAISYSSINDGSADGVASGYDTITYFAAGVDKIAITGELWSALDKNHDGVLNETPIILSDRVSGSLTDSGYANFRTAVGSTNEGGIWIANNGTDSAVYLLAPPDGDSTLRSVEVRCLALVKNAILSASDISV